MTPLCNTQSRARLAPGRYPPKDVDVARQEAEAPDEAHAQGQEGQEQVQDQGEGLQAAEADEPDGRSPDARILGVAKGTSRTSKKGTGKPGLLIVIGTGGLPKQPRSGRKPKAPKIG
jgi:hypothetical protein